MSPRSNTPPSASPTTTPCWAKDPMECQDRVELLMSIPGIDRASVRAIVIELDPDVGGFASPRHCAAWAGFVRATTRAPANAAPGEPDAAIPRDGSLDPCALRCVRTAGAAGARQGEGENRAQTPEASCPSRAACRKILPRRKQCPESDPSFQVLAHPHRRLMALKHAHCLSDNRPCHGQFTLLAPDRRGAAGARPRRSRQARGAQFLVEDERLISSPALRLKLIT